MKIKPGQETAYQEDKARNSDRYGSACFNFAEDWAALMEARMAGGELLPAIAKPSSHKADTYGLTGFMYGCAVSLLTVYWEHGEDLRQWHNLATQIGTEGEAANAKEGAVLNPAMLICGGG